MQEWAEYHFSAVLLPFQCEFEVLMSYEFYANHIFKGTPPPSPKNGEGDALRGWFPIQTRPSGLTRQYRDPDLFPNAKFDQGRGLVMSDLPCPIMVSDKVRGGRSVREKNFLRKEDDSNLYTWRMCTGDWHTRPKVDREV